MAKIHFVLQAKGGVGKSTISSLLAQYKKSKGEAITCIDTDQLNASFNAYKALNVIHLQLLEDEQINPRNFDKLIEIISDVEDDVIIDNGASTFFPLSHYLITNEIPELLESMGHKAVIHTIITAGQALLDTLNALNSLVKSFGKNCEIIVWLNPFWGNIEYNGKSFTEMAVYKNNKDSINTVIELPKLAQDTFSSDLAEMLQNRQTFTEGIEDEKNPIMVRQRLKIIQSKIYALLDQAGV
ncbi:conjugal transfer protein TraL [Pasteurella multocida]